MLFKALFNKEIILLRKNWLLLFANLIIPIITLGVTLVYSGSSYININIGYSDTSFDSTSFNKSLNEISESVILNLIKYDNMEQLKDAYINKEIDCYLEKSGDRYLNIYTNLKTDKGLISYQYIITTMNNINYSNYDTKLIDEIVKNQTYKLNSVVPIETEINNEIPSFLWVGFLWIFIYANLNNSVSQMQQEKNTKTILYLIKAPVNKLALISSKLIAVIIQFIFMFVGFTLITHLLGLLEYRFNILQLIYWLIVVICIASIGQLIGTVIKNPATLVIVQMILILPVMMINTVQSSQFDIYLKNTPFFCCVNIAKAAFLNQRVLISDLLISIITTIICYALLILYLKKVEPMKICES